MDTPEPPTWSRHRGRGGPGGAGGPPWRRRGGLPPLPLIVILALIQVLGSQVTSQRHEQIELNDFNRRLLGLLDGSRDRAALREAMADLVARGETTFWHDGQSVGDAATAGSTAVVASSTCALTRSDCYRANLYLTRSWCWCWRCSPQ